MLHLSPKYFVIALLGAAFSNPTAAHSAEINMQKNGEMALYRAAQVELIDRDTALAIAKGVISHHLGAEELALQEPLSISKKESIFVIEGNNQYGRRKDGSIRGPVRMEISAFDGQITSYILTEDIAH